MPPSLVMLDTADSGFVADLEHLDSMSCRIYDTVHVFYVKSGQKMPFEILSNVVCGYCIHRDSIRWILWITHEYAAAVCRDFLVTPLEARVL